MDIGYLILMSACLAAMGFFMLQYKPFKESVLIWFYLLSGALALYSVETADTDQPFYLTAVIALLLCLVPTMVDAMLSLLKATNVTKRKHFISHAKNCRSH